MKSMYDTILELPLFQGISSESLTTILDKAALHFEKKSQGEVIIQSGTTCNELTFIIEGNVEKTTQGKENSTFIASEPVSTPYVIEPCSLFGKQTVYRSTYTALSNVNVMSISKDYVVQILMKDEVFLFNFLNQICKHSQLLENKLWDMVNYSHSMVEGGLDEMS